MNNTNDADASQALLVIDFLPNDVPAGVFPVPLATGCGAAVGPSSGAGVAGDDRGHIVSQL
jgi:hypothetical protein